MEKFTEILTKSEENKLTPEQKKEYRLWKKTKIITERRNPVSDEISTLVQEIRKQRYNYCNAQNDPSEDLTRAWIKIADSDSPRRTIKVLKSYDYLQYRDSLNDILVEGLKFPDYSVRKQCNKFYDKLLRDGLVDHSLWRKILEKKYVSHRTWKKLIQYYPVAKELGISEQILECITSFVQRAQDIKAQGIHLAQWKKMNINPVELYSE